MPENTCGTLFYCFLTTANIGTRFHAGIGFVLQPQSYLQNGGGFAARTFYDFVFFLIIIIILLHIIFGIILETFRALRKKAFETEHDIANICFICGVERDTLEKKSINFNQHCKEEHNVWDYVDYMITIRLKNIQDLNATNSYVKEHLESNNIAWLPVEEETKEDHLDEGEHDKSVNSSVFK